MDDDDEYSITFPSASSPPNTTFLPDDGIMELLWQNGPVFMPCQNHGPPRKPPPPKHPGDVTTLATEVEIRPSPQVENCSSQLLFMQEDEMASWLHSPVVDDSPLDHNFYLLYSPHTAVNDSATMQTSVCTSQVTEFRQPSTSVAPPALPMPLTWEPKIQESEQFSKHNGNVKSGLSRSRTTARESTVVDSCDAPVVVATSRASDAVIRTEKPAEIAACCGSMNTAEIVGPSTTTASGGTEGMTCEMTATSSPGGSTGSAELSNRSLAEDRKRKGREADASGCHIDDSAEAKQEVGGSKSTKRSRAAEVHNLSERRRRDRINEKMRALQELIPRCNKSDKASMLDEAIEYLKSLQLQVQMMSMGCGMVPMNMMMCPGMPVMPFPAHMGPSLSRMPDNMLTSLTSSHPIHSRIPNLPHAYPQRLGPHQIQSHFMQNQTMMQQDISKPSTSRAHENPENHHSENG